jgi:hypothetical protein
MVSTAMLDKIAKAKASKNGNYVRPGKYLFEVQKVDVFDGYNGTMFLAELIVLESSSTGARDRAGNVITPNPVGSWCSYVVNLGNECGPGNAKAFVMALFNEPEEEVTSEVLAELCSVDEFKGGECTREGQPARFLTIRDEVFDKPQKKKPDQYVTVHRWEHVAPTEAQLKMIGERRAAERAAGKKY